MSYHYDCLMALLCPREGGKEQDYHMWEEHHSWKGMQEEHHKEEHMEEEHHTSHMDEHVDIRMGMKDDANK